MSALMPLSMCECMTAHLSKLRLMNMTEEMGRKNKLLNPAFIIFRLFYSLKARALTHEK